MLINLELTKLKKYYWSQLIFQKQTPIKIKSNLPIFAQSKHRSIKLIHAKFQMFE